MFYVVSKQSISGYVPMKIASSVDEAIELISSYEKILENSVRPNGEEIDECGNYVRKFAAWNGRNAEYYSVTQF